MCTKLKWCLYGYFVNILEITTYLANPYLCIHTQRNLAFFKIFSIMGIEICDLLIIYIFNYIACD